MEGFKELIPSNVYFLVTRSSEYLFPPSRNVGHNVQTMLINYYGNEYGLIYLALPG